MTKSLSLFAYITLFIVTLTLVACGGEQAQDPTPVPPTATAEAVEPSATSVPPTATLEPSPTATSEPTATPTPEEETIGYDETVRGSIDEEGEDVTYFFEGVEGETVIVRLETVRGQLEPFAALYADDDTLLATSPTNGDFEVSFDHVIDADGTYYLVVEGVDNSTGTFELTLQRGQVGGDLSYGDSVTGLLDEDSPEGVWTFEGSYGDFVDIAVTAAGGLDTRIDLYYGDDEFIEVSDDYEDLNPRIVGYPLLREGTYTIIVSVVGEEAEGTYTLTLNEVEGTVGTVTLDEAVEGTLGEGSQLYTFEGEAEQSISIAVDIAEGDNVDPYVIVYAPDGQEIATDDDSGEGTNSLIRELTLPDDGVYAIVIMTYGGEGDFTLTVGPAQAPVSAGVIAYGGTVQGEIVGTELQAWTFDAQSGDAVTIAANRLDDSTGLDVRIALRDPEGVELITDDDSGEENNALIEGYPILQSGTYTIIVYAYSGTGLYELLLTGEAAASIAIGDTVSGEILADAWLLWTFEGTEGDVINISATSTALENSLDLYLVIVGPDGEILDSDDDSGGDLNPSIEALPLPVTGPYLIVLSPFRGEGTFDLVISIAE